MSQVSETVGLPPIRAGKLVRQAAKLDARFLNAFPDQYPYYPKQEFRTLALIVFMLLGLNVAAFASDPSDPRYPTGLVAICVINILLVLVLMNERREHRRRWRESWDTCQADPRWSMLTELANWLEEWDARFETIASDTARRRQLDHAALYHFNQLRQYHAQLVGLAERFEWQITHIPLGSPLLCGEPSWDSPEMASRPFAREYQQFRVQRRQLLTRYAQSSP